jgi:hypothetical protein
VGDVPNAKGASDGKSAQVTVNTASVNSFSHERSVIQRFLVFVSALKLYVYLYISSVYFMSDQAFARSEWVFLNSAALS